MGMVVLLPQYRMVQEKIYIWKYNAPEPNSNFIFNWFRKPENVLNKFRKYVTTFL